MLNTNHKNKPSQFKKSLKQQEKQKKFITGIMKNGKIIIVRNNGTKDRDLRNRHNLKND